MQLTFPKVIHPARSNAAGSKTHPVVAIGLYDTQLLCLAVLAGRDVVHWIDNTSAKAALVHGYSGALDSSRLVHALHAYNLGLRARPWFEYVRSKANPADEPSRGICLSGSVLPGVCKK